MAETTVNAGTPHEAPTETYASLREIMAVFPQHQGWLGARMGMSRSDIDGLLIICEQPIGPSDLANRLGLTHAAGSQVVDRLQARGLVKRTPDANDGRRVMVSGTAAAYPEVATHLSAVFTEMREIEKGFTDDELATVRRYLGQAAEALRLRR
ncbi:MAG: MarR family winged helix-turn-helix transcriptional regulator [Miltoncostaeaceae bacterium]